MEFTKKIKSLVGLKDQIGGRAQFDISPSPLADEIPKPVFSKFSEAENEFPNDPLMDREAIESIEDIYFTENNFDPSDYEIKHLGDSFDQVTIDTYRNKLRRQQRAVSKKVSDLVLENHPAYQRELQRVMELEESLQTGSVICQNGRKQLSRAKQTFTTASLGLLANYQKREKLVALLKSLRTIKTLQRTDIRLREMLEEEDYPGAIQVCLECQKAASSLKHYKCISELSSKLQDTLELIEEALDVALSKTCSRFDMKHYEKVQMGYHLLGKTQTAMDQLHMHFTSAIHNTAFTIVLGYVELCSGTADTNFQKRQYPDLCRNVMPEVFTPCLIDLCKALWEVMRSYHLTIKWHDDHMTDETLSDTAGSGVEASIHRRYIKQKLEHGLGRIWQDVQQKVKQYLLSTDLSHFKFDDFLKVLDLINRLREIGEEFCGSKSETLQDSIRQQSINYFHNYHRARLDELRMFLENEGWELCPVKSGFTIVQLQEFRFLRPLLSKAGTASEPVLGQLKTCTEDDSSQSGDTYFTQFLDEGNPFDLQVDDDENEDVMATNGAHRQESFGAYGDSDSDEDIPEELKRDYVDEETGDTPSPTRTVSPPMYKRKVSARSGHKLPPIITNTTLTVLRLIGKYLQMMNNLKPIAFDVLYCMSQLFDYYMYTVHSFFATDTSDQSEVTMGTRLRTTLRRIKDNLILPDIHAGSVPPSPDEVRDKIGHPHLSPIVDLTSIGGFYGLSERIVAVESLVFLSHQLQFLQPYLESMIPATKKAFLQQFYSQTVDVSLELRHPVYRAVATQSIDYDQLLQMMASVKWDVRDIMSQHSGYVDVVLREFELVRDRLTTTSRRVPLPPEVTRVLWEHCVRLTNAYFVEGYAAAKKCSNEGRALMQLDYQQFLMQLDKLANIRPVPDRELVEAYIKAYYLPEEQLEKWMKDHKEYSAKQLSALVNCMGHFNKKSRQRLLIVIEEMSSRR